VLASGRLSPCCHGSTAVSCQKWPVSFDHLVGLLQKLLRDGDAKRFGGLEIDDEVELARKLHRQIARLGALQDAIDIGRRLLVDLGQIDSVRDKAAACGEEPIRIDRRRAMSGRQGDDEVAVKNGDGIRYREQRAIRLLRERIDGALPLGSMSENSAWQDQRIATSLGKGQPPFAARILTHGVVMVVATAFAMAHSRPMASMPGGFSAESLRAARNALKGVLSPRSRRPGGDPWWPPNDIGGEPSATSLTSTRSTWSLSADGLQRPLCLRHPPNYCSAAKRRDVP
jgi:hypothetical protein